MARSKAQQSLDKYMKNLGSTLGVLPQKEYGTLIKRALNGTQFKELHIYR